MEYKDLYKDDYFSSRFSNDPNRLRSFQEEYRFFSKHASSGVVLDVGCSTGEFLTCVRWTGDKYGMEISELAKKEALKNGILFDKDLTNSKDFFDVIIFRGTIQHIDQPFHFIQKSFDALKPGGFVVFLATPNINSLYYKIWNTLPALDPKLNLYIPSDVILKDLMKLHGFDFIDIEYPYWGRAYSQPSRDHLKFFMKLLCLGPKSIRFPFWRNMMNVVFQKPLRSAK